MTDRLEGKTETLVEPSVRLSEGLSQQDHQKTMNAVKDNLATSQTANTLPTLEVFDSLDVKPAVDKNLANWDNNGDSRLSENELNAVLESGSTSDEEKAAAGLKRAFVVVDTNHDGNIDKSELEKYDAAAQVYERTRARIDNFAEVAGGNFGKIDENQNGELSRTELLSFANDASNGLSEADRQIMREFATKDFGLVAIPRSNKTGNPVGYGIENSSLSIQSDDVDRAGKRLKTKTIEGHSMSAPALIHDMYRVE